MSKHLSRDAMIELGVAIANGRREGVAWKVLCRVYNAGERKLRRYYDLATREMSDNSGQMSDLSACGANARQK